jgi:SAM-dependent methyltransferase
MSNEFWPEDNERNIRYYTELVEKYGADVQALDWGSEQSQRLRFQMLALVGNLDGSRVLDVGCGIGDFFGWLRDCGKSIEYTGVDITPRMIEVARQRFPDARFEVTNLLETRGEEACFDFVFSSGIFYLRRNEPFEYLKTMVSALYERCRQAVAFNSLSSWASSKAAGEFYADPLETVAFCRTLTPWVVLRHDYHPGDFTIYMYKREKMT